jgi:hypothetical protein
MSYALRIRVLAPLAAAVWLAISGPASAHANTKTLEERLKAIDAKALTKEDCVSELSRSASANAPELIYGGRVCELVGSFVESSFLFGAGQLRALTDIMLMPPATKADDQGLLPLYTMLYFGGGATGIKDEVLHDPNQRQKFLLLLEQWRPSYSQTYNPGWNARKQPDAEKYHSTVAEAKAGLRQQLDRTVRLVSDDQYYSLHRQYMEILERHPKGLPADTPAGKLAADLERRIRERMVALGEEVGPSPSDLSDATKERNPNSELREDDRFPPHSPDKDESVLSNAVGPTVDRCLDLAERSAVSQGGKIVRVLVTSSKKWGTIWRADMTADGQPLTRFTCTEATSSSSPLEVDNIPPLPATADRSR